MNPESFLHQKDPELHTSDPVEHEQERRALADEETHQKPADKLADWMQILERTHMGHRDDPQVLERIKASYERQYVIDPDTIPESAYLLEQKIARSLGHGTIEITDDFRKKKQAEIVSAQKESLDKWIDYLTGEDADYAPTWAKYWAFTQMLKMGKFEKQEDEEGKESARFAKREGTTVAPFPPMNPRALAMVIGLIKQRVEEKQKAKSERLPITNTSTKLTDEEFQQLLAGESFGKLYTQFLIELPEYSREGLEETRGEWITYPQGSSPDELVHSLDGYPLEWCTANTDTARTQLEGGDFLVYYSIDQSGNPVIPRVAIRMQKGSIAEVRGIAPNQNLDPYIADVAKSKLHEFPDGTAYEKKSEDMKRLTDIEQASKKGEALTREDLIFLYEVDQPIEGFGYQRDPRIKELQSTRNPEQDMPIVFDCTPEDIAHSQEEVTDTTKAYIGPMFQGIFETRIEHLFTTFPEGKVQRYNIEIGGKSKDELVQALADKGIKISEYAEDILNSRDFHTSNSKESASLVRLTVRDIGFPYGATTDDIYARADELGLELCPPETGPELRLALNSPDWMLIAMKQITDEGGHPYVFSLDRAGDGLWLDGYGARPSRRWLAYGKFVFRTRQGN